MIRARSLALAACVLITAIWQIEACDWDYPVWPKSKKSDTPLFRFVVREKDGAGYINRQGKIVIPPRFSGAMNQGGDFYNGRARVYSAQVPGAFFIDPTGKRIPGLNGLPAGDFFEGVSSTRFARQGKLGYVDQAGKVVIPAKFDFADSFSEGLALVSMQGSYGFIDHSGKLVIPARFAWAAGFADGHALVIERGVCTRFGYAPCDRLNGPEFVPDGARAGLTKDAQASTPRCRYSVVDHTGRVTFSGSYIEAKRFSEGLAPVGDGKQWGFADYSGKVRIPLQFDNAEPFSEGLALVRRGGKAGFVDKSGSLVISPQFDSAEAFSEGRAVVIDKGQYSFIDKSGKRIIAEQFDGASSFVMGLAHVRKGRGDSATWSYIDATGKAVFTYSMKR